MPTRVTADRIMRFPVVRIAALGAACLALSGCVASSLLSVATLPVQILGKAVDLATTSQSEADEKRGRAYRKRDEELGKLQSELARQQGRCEDGSGEACRSARQIEKRMVDLRTEPF